MTPRALLLPSIALVVVACVPQEVRPSAAKAATHRLTASDSVVVPSALQRFVAQPFSLGAIAGGALLIGDHLHSTVVVVPRDGSPGRLVGSRGPGPGEIRKLNGIFALDDSLVAVMDAGDGRLEIFSVSTGTHRGSVFLGGPVAPATIPPQRGDTAVIGLRTARTSAARIVWSQGQVMRMGAMPEQFTVFQDLRRGSSQPVVRFGDSLLVGHGALNGLLVLRTDGTLVDSIEIPRVHRRGTARRALAAVRGDWATYMRSVSHLTLAQRLPDNRVAVVFHDDSASTEEVPVIQSRLHISLLSPSLDSACVDIEVPVRSDGRPQVAIGGDTLFVLQQRITDTTSTAVVTMFALGNAPCARQPIGPGPLLAP